MTVDLGQLPFSSMFFDLPKRSPLLSRHLDTPVGEVKHCLLGIQSQGLVWAHWTLERVDALPLILL